MRLNSDIARQFIGWAAMSLVAWVILKLIPDANYASALVGIICTFLGNLLAGGATNLPAADQASGPQAFRKLSTAGSFASLCLVVAISWLLALSADDFLNSHLEMMIGAGLLKIETHKANVVLQVGWFEMIGRFVFLPTLLILSGVIGLISPKRMFVLTMLAVGCIIGIYVVGNLVFEVIRGNSQMAAIFGAVLGNEQSSQVPVMASALRIIVVVGALLGIIVALPLMMLTSIFFFRLILKRQLRRPVASDECEITE